MRPRLPRRPPRYPAIPRTEKIKQYTAYPAITPQPFLPLRKFKDDLQSGSRLSAMFGMGTKKARNCHFGLSRCELRYEPEALNRAHPIGFSGRDQQDFHGTGFHNMPVVQSRIRNMPKLLARTRLLRRAVPQGRISAVQAPPPATVPSDRIGQKGPSSRRKSSSPPGMVPPFEKHG